MDITTLEKMITPENLQAIEQIPRLLRDVDRLQKLVDIQVTMKQAEELLGVSYPTLVKIIRNGELVPCNSPTQKNNKFKLSEVTSLAERLHAVGSTRLFIAKTARLGVVQAVLGENKARHKKK